MPLIPVVSPYQIFRDRDGAPLEAGYLYIGAENQEPIANPIAVYWDAALTIQADQPIRTLNGYPAYLGSPANLFANANHSITVKDKKGTLVFTRASSSWEGSSVRADLAVNNDPDRGAGMIGFTAGLAYPAGSDGAYLNYLKGLVDALGVSLTALAINGQCQFRCVDANTCRLYPHNGNKLVIDDTVRTIPALGVALSSVGLLAATLYYVYAYWSGGTMLLEASTTGHSTDSTTGVEVKTGDDTRTLVGMVYTKTAATFEDSSAHRFVASWFNRRPRPVEDTFSVDRTQAFNAAFVEVDAENRCEFISPGGGVHVALAGWAWIDTATWIQPQLVLGGSSVETEITVPAINAHVSVSLASFIETTEGYHYLALKSRHGVGTSTYAQDTWTRAMVFI